MTVKGSATAKAVFAAMRTGEFQQAFCEWRGVEDPCERCHGAGQRTYGSTSTWRGGIGGSAMTLDVCDSCWGTGDKNRTGADLRKLYAELDRLRKSK